MGRISASNVRISIGCKLISNSKTYLISSLSFNFHFPVTGHLKKGQALAIN